MIFSSRFVSAEIFDPSVAALRRSRSRRTPGSWRTTSKRLRGPTVRQSPIVSWDLRHSHPKGGESGIHEAAVIKPCPRASPTPYSNQEVNDSNDFICGGAKKTFRRSEHQQGIEMASWMFVRFSCRADPPRTRTTNRRLQFHAYLTRTHRISAHITSAPQNATQKVFLCSAGTLKIM